MKIIEELPFSLPSLPSGYVWDGGFPQFRVPVKGEHFIRYHSKTGFGDVVKCDGNFQIPFGEETRRIIVVPVERQDGFVGEGYRKLGTDEYFTPSSAHECCPLSDLGTNKEKWGKVLWSNQVSRCKDYVFREKVVDSQPKESVAVQSQQKVVVEQPKSLSTEGMIEVSHLPHYIVQRDDIYVENGKAFSAGSLISLHPVKWYGSADKLFATKKNYGDYVSKNSLKPEHSVTVAEGPAIGPGYREINSQIDTPQEGDQFWSSLHKQWIDRPVHYGAFNHIDIYRRINKLTAKNDVSVQVPVIGASAPIQNVSAIWAIAPIQKENVMSGTKSEETVKFETAKKVAVSTAKFAGKAIWRTADYFVFAPIKKAASPFMWMVRYAVLGTMIGGGVYTSFNPDDAKELLWKCVPKISISVEAPEVLG